MSKLFQKLALGMLVATSGATLATDLASFVDQCPNVQMALTNVRETNADETFYSLVAWEEFLPRVRALYSQRQLVAGPRTNLNIGVQGTVANPVRTYSLVNYQDSLWKKKLEGARAELFRTRQDWIDRFFEWQYAYQVLKVFEAAEGGLLGFSSASPNNSLINFELAADASAILLDGNESKITEARLRRQLAQCGADPATVTFENPTPDQVRGLASQIEKQLPEEKSCRAEIDMDRYQRQAVQWGWLPNVVYSYSHATPLLQNNFIFSEWSVGFELTIPLSAFAASAPTTSSCEVRASSASRKFSELASKAEVSIAGVGNLNQLISNLESLLKRATNSKNLSSVTPERYLVLLKNYVRARRSLRDSLSAIQQIWIPGNKI